MNGVATAFLVISALALLGLPRKWAPVPIIAAACYITRAQGIDLGPFRFTVIRLLVVAGFCRVILRRETLASPVNSLDILVILWGCCMIATGFAHTDAITNRLGLTFDGWGLYFLFRTFCRSIDDLRSLTCALAVTLTPIAIEMLVEKSTARNYFAFLGAPDLPSTRDGHVRAQGPFAHSILAGNIGAVCLPLLIGLWTHHRGVALLGVSAAIAMVFASTSSGPVMSAVIGLFALTLWPLRARVKVLGWLALAVYIVLELVMTRPAYFIMAWIDVTGGSTGWHRARLIQSAFQHLGEWWLAGTDYTRHWMASGVSWSPDHADITNHYLRMGVLGGLPLMVLFIAMMWYGFVLVGKSLRASRDLPENNQFFIWAVGSSLFAHTATCISVSYFDQSIVFLYLTLASTGILLSQTVVTSPETIRTAHALRGRLRRSQKGRRLTSSTSMFPGRFVRRARRRVATSVSD